MSGAVEKLADGLRTQGHPAQPAARSRSRDLLGDTYARYFDAIYRFCYFRLFDKGAVEDVVSTVFLRLAERPDWLDQTSESDVRNWLYGSARNAISSHARAHKRRKVAIEALRSLRAVRAADDRSDFDRLDWPRVCEAILGLSSRSRRILMLRFFEGLLFKEIAEVLDMKPTSVRVAYSRAIDRLRKRLRPMV